MSGLEEIRAAAARVLELDRAATSGPWVEFGCEIHATDARRTIVAEVTGSYENADARADREMIADYRTTAPTLARAVLALLDVVDPALAQLAILDMENR